MRSALSKFLIYCFSLSECYFAGKGSALVLPAEAQKSSRKTGANGSNIQKHLQSMFYLLRPEETLKMVSERVRIRVKNTLLDKYLFFEARLGRVVTIVNNGRINE